MLITHSIDCASASSGEGISTSSTSGLCTPPVRPSPPSPSRETCRGVPVRPQLLSSAVFSCLLHRRVIRTPHPHTRAHGMWVTDPNSTPRGRAFGGGGAPDHRRPSQRRKAPPPGMPFRHPHSEQRRPARAHAVGPGLGPHARTDRTRDPRVAEPRLPAPEDGRPGEGQRLTPDAPHNDGRPGPPGTAPHHPRGTQPSQGMQAKGTVLGPYTHTPAPTARGWRIPTARPAGRQSGGEQRLTSDAPHNGGRHPPQGRPSATPTASNAGPQGRTLWGRCWVPTPHRPHPGHTGRGTLAAHSRGRAAGGGTAPDTRPPSQRWQATPPGNGPPPAPRHAAPTGHAGQGDSVGPPHPHTRAHSTWVADPDSPPSGRAVGGGTAPDLRRPSQWWKATPPGDALPPPPQRATPARKGARCWAGAGSPGPHGARPGHTGCGAPAARSRGRAAGRGTAPDTRRPSQRWQATPPRGRPPTTPAARSPHRACRPRGQCWAPTPTHPRSQHVGGGPRQPAQWAGSRGRDSA